MAEKMPVWLPDCCSNVSFAICAIIGVIDGDDLPIGSLDGARIA